MASPCRCPPVPATDPDADSGSRDDRQDADAATLGDRAHAVVREWLIAGVLSPGDKLSLRTVADWLGMAMQPVRQAVSRLVADQALEVTPNRAVRVPVLSAERFRELTVIRLSIEGFAAERAATRRSAAELVRIRRDARRFHQECVRARPDLARAVQCNRDLHFSVYRAAGLPALVPIIEGLWLRIGPVLNLDMRSSPQRLRTGLADACHLALVAALEAGSGARARAAVQRDIRAAARFILQRGVLPDGRGPVASESAAAAADGAAPPRRISTRTTEATCNWESRV